MPKDYAKHSYRKKRKANFKWRNRLLMVAIFILLIVSIGGFYGYQYKKEIIELTDKFALLFKEKKVPLSKASIEKESQKPEVQFHFYTELSKLSVESAVNATSEVNLQQYVVRIASFSNEKDAREMRISLLLSNIEAQLVKSNAGASRMFYLQKGPFTTLNEAKKVQEKLKQKGYENAIIVPL